MIDMVAAVMAKMAEKIRRYPCHVNRASSLGYAVPQLGGCLRRGVYERTHWQQKELVDAETQMIFQEGHNQEAAVLRDLSEAGIQIIEQQTPYEWKEYCITGHLDGKVVDIDVAIPVEVKSMHPAIFDGTHNFEDFKKHPWTRSYMVQIMLYMLMQGVDKGIFILKNKSNGQLRQINVELDYELGEWAIKAAEAINKHIADGTLPEPITDRETCKKCPFKTICLPEINFGEELKIVDDPDFEKRLIRYLKTKPAAKECDTEYEIIKSRIKATAKAAGGNCNLMVGQHHVTGTQGEKKFTVKIEKI